MIKLTVKGKEKIYTNEEGIKILQKGNRKDKFRISICKETEQATIQVWDKGYKEWVCLHD